MFLFCKFLRQKITLFLKKIPNYFCKSQILRHNAKLSLKIQQTLLISPISTLILHHSNTQILHLAQNISCNTLFLLLQLPSSSEPNSMKVRSMSALRREFHRVWFLGRTESQRIYNGITTDLPFIFQFISLVILDFLFTFALIINKKQNNIQYEAGFEIQIHLAKSNYNTNCNRFDNRIVGILEYIKNLFFNASR